MTDAPSPWTEEQAKSLALLAARDAEIARLRESLANIAALPHSNPTGDTLHGPCPRCLAEAALDGKAVSG